MPDVDAAWPRRAGFRVDGEKLRGSYALVHRAQQPDKAKTPWLLIRHRDASSSTRDIAEEQPRSVVSGRLLIEIARDEGGNLRKAASGDPPALLKKLLARPELIQPPKRSRRKSVWHSNRKLA